MAVVAEPRAATKLICAMPAINSTDNRTNRWVNGDPLILRPPDQLPFNSTRKAL